MQKWQLERHKSEKYFNLSLDHIFLQLLALEIYLRAWIE